MGKVTVDKFAQNRGCGIPKGSNLVETLFTLISEILNSLGEQAVLDILSKRLGWSDIGASFDSSFLDLDDAIECLHHDDHRQVHKAEDDAKAMARMRMAFRDDLRKQAEVVRARAKCKAKAQPPVKKKEFPTTMSQTEAKAMLPPGSSIWRAISHGAWAGHCPPFKRVSAPWSLGEYDAMKHVIARLWRQYLEKTGRPLSDCPYLGLIESLG